MENNIVSWIITILSLGAAILAWVVKLRWSKEFSAAKNEIIKAKEAQICSVERELEMIKNISSLKFQEHFKSVKYQLEQYIDDLKDQNRELQQKLDASKVKYRKRLENQKEEASKKIKESRKELKLIKDMADIMKKYWLDDDYRYEILKDSSKSGGKMATTGEKPGKGKYVCTKCGQVVVLDDRTDTLPPCPKCHNTSFRKIS